MRRLSPSHALVSAAVFALAACAVGPDYQRPELDTPQSWTRELGGLAEVDLKPQSLGAWWRTLEDPTLSELIERAVAANLDLRTAESQLRQARAERARSSGALFPTLGASGAARKQGRLERDAPSSSSELYSAGFDAAWEIDVFGGLRRANEAAAADEQAAVEIRRDVLVSVLAEVALNYTELRTFQAQLDIASRNLRNQEDTLGIVEAKANEGAATELELQQATSNAAKTRAEIPALTQNMLRAKNRLCGLVGKPPGALDVLLDPGRELPSPPSQVAVGVPAETLRRRPDVRVAERRLAAEVARVGVATAELYPKFVLNGSIGIESTSMAGLGGVYDFGPQVQWSIFSAGRVRREIEIQSEVQEQALIDYEGAILNALEDVENSITAFAEEQVRLQALAESTVAAERAAGLASARYEAGMTAFLDVLDAQRTRLAAESSAAASEGELLSNLIRLYKSLGGGWESLEPTSP